MTLIDTRDIRATAREQIERRAQGGEIRHLYAGLYTDDLTTAPEVIIRNELFAICAALAPLAVISHRTALELAPTTEGNVFLTGPYRRTVRLYGHQLTIAQGESALPSDVRIPTPLGDTHRSSDARALLENLQRMTSPAAESRSLGRAAVEAWLEDFLKREGEQRLQQLRAQALAVSGELQFLREFGVLDKCIGVLLG